MKNQKQFADKISLWGVSNNREMPWKGEKNPYYIWLSEIILQQTRVEQGLKYFVAFKETFPTVFDLAKAPQEQVLKLWEGLGYYSRARNLHFTAKYIVEELNGVFPDNFNDLLKLKGVGAYTAAAIASFAYDIPKAVVDGNVIRVLSRYFGIETQFDKAKEKANLQNFADEIINTQNPAIYNQAIMDFGASICAPKKVDCSQCFITENCFAFKHNKQLELPLSKKKIKVKDRFFSFLILKHKNDILIEQRLSKDIWKGLYQFPLLEHKKESISNKTKLKALISEKLDTIDFEILEVSEIFNQKLTHQKLNANFVEIALKKPINTNFLNTSIKNLSKFAFPKIINVYLDNKLGK
ncbi:MAG: A/G-specific adenine glycosylase [Chitinophagales bacterium]